MWAATRDRHKNTARTLRMFCRCGRWVTLHIIHQTLILPALFFLLFFSLFALPFASFSSNRALIYFFLRQPNPCLLESKKQREENWTKELWMKFNGFHYERQSVKRVEWSKCEKKMPILTRKLFLHWSKLATNVYVSCNIVNKDYTTICIYLLNFWSRI